MRVGFMAGTVSSAFTDESVSNLDYYIMKSFISPNNLS